MLSAAFARRLPAAARHLHAAPALQHAAGSPSFTGTVYKESEKAREVRLFCACTGRVAGEDGVGQPSLTFTQPS